MNPAGAGYGDPVPSRRVPLRDIRDEARFLRRRGAAGAHRYADGKAKRLMDVAVSLAVLMVSLPLWPMIALAIKLDSRGPVFYTQTRVGADGVGALRVDFSHNIDKQLPHLAQPDINESRALGGVFRADVVRVDAGEALGENPSQLFKADAVGENASALVRELDITVLADRELLFQVQLPPDGEDDDVARADEVFIIQGTLEDRLRKRPEDVVSEGGQGLRLRSLFLRSRTGETAAQDQKQHE